MQRVLTRRSSRRTTMTIKTVTRVAVLAVAGSAAASWFGGKAFQLINEASAIARQASAPEANGSAKGDQMSPEQTRGIETWGYTLAVQAATYGAPLVAMYNLRSTVAFGPNAKAQPNTLWRLENISTPTLSAESGYVSPNVNVVYGFGFADLGAEPIILTAPDSGGRYYMIEVVDMWTNAFAYPAGLTSGYNGGKFAFVAPGWQGTLPSGVKRIDAPTRWIEFQPRVFVKDETDLAAARKVLERITLQGLSQYTGGPAPTKMDYQYELPRMNPKVATSRMQFDDPLQFWSIFSSALNENPPPRNQIEVVLPQYVHLGIELGKRWKPENVNPIILEQMKKASRQIGDLALATMATGGRLSNGWVIPPPNTGLAGTDYLSRLDVAVFGLTANTVTEAIYYAGILDGNNEPMIGAKRYTMTFKGPMQYARAVPPGFWSLTMYDKTTNYSIPNSINRYSLGSMSNLKKNSDGSFVLYLQADNPGADKESNWLPAPEGPFYLILRNYAPDPELAKALQLPDTFEGPPPVMPVGGAVGAAGKTGGG